MKKTLALLLAFVMVFSTITVAFADEATIGADAKAVTSIGMLVGNGGGVTADYLTTTPTRIQAAVMFLRLKGLEAEAKAFTGEANFADADTAEWAKPIMAYLKAHPELGWIGDGTNFSPNKVTSAKEYYKVMLEALGYKQNTDTVVGDFTWDNVVEFAASKGLTKAAAATTFTVNDLATATVEALKATVKGTEKALVATLIEAGKIEAAKAQESGLYTPAPVVTAVKVASAASLTSKVIEVSLTEAAAKVDATLFTVKDAAGTAVEVAAAELAGWDTANKTVLVTLKADTKVGTLYTMTSGTTNANFGGKAADTAKPTVKDAVATDYNKVTITFSEPIKLDGATIAMTEKYGAKAKLNFTEMKYAAKDAIVLTTDAQKGSTLYGMVIENVADFSGNVMDKDEAKTFVGKTMSTLELKVEAAKANDYNEVIVKFNENVDPATVAATAFKIEEMYGTNKATVAVTGAVVAAKGDLNELGAEIADAATAKKYVKLTVDGTMKASTLYKITVTGLKTLYGKNMSATAGDNFKSFTGAVKPTGEFGFATTKFQTPSNTEVVINFARRVDEATAGNAANYVITEAYGAKTALEVKAAEVDGSSVTLTVAPMKTVLYTITVSNVKDIYGNALKTADKVNSFNFTGKAVAAKIAAIKSIVRVDATTIEVKFDQNVGDSAIDVAHYTIDKNVGYPEKAVIKSGTTDTVTLTIPKTTTGDIYKLTVKGLENADGVAMGADGVTGSFVGQGLSATEPSLVAVIPVDNQTLKIFFDRDVTDKKIDGPIWNSTDYALTNALKIYDEAHKDAGFTVESKSYAYQDAENANVLVVRINKDTALFTEDKALKSTGAFRLVGTKGIIDEDALELAFAPISAKPAEITIDAVMALNNKTIKVYFDQPVYGTDMHLFAQIVTSETGKYGDGDALTLAGSRAVDSTNKVYEFSLTGKMASANTHYLVVNPSLATSVLSDSQNAVNKFVTLKDEDDSTAKVGIQHNRPFAGISADPTLISDFSVTMTDEKTIVVYYPEAMKEGDTGTNGAATASAIDFDNYKIVDKDGNVVNMIATGGAKSAFAATDIAKISYKAADNSVTITLNKKIEAPATGVFLKVDVATANAIGTSNVKDKDNAAISRQFAVSTEASAKVTVASAVYSTVKDGEVTYGVVTIKLSQDFKTTANLAGNEDEALKAFTITVKDINGNEHEVDAADIQEITVEDNNGNTIPNSATTKIRVVKVRFLYELKANQVGTVTFVETAAITGINGNGIDKDSSATFSH